MYFIIFIFCRLMPSRKTIVVCRPTKVPTNQATKRDNDWAESGCWRLWRALTPIAAQSDPRRDPLSSLSALKRAISTTECWPAKLGCLATLTTLILIDVNLDGSLSQPKDGCSQSHTHNGPSAAGGTTGWGSPLSTEWKWKSGCHAVLM